MWKGKTRRKICIKTKIMIKRGKGGGEEWGRNRKRIEEKRRNRKNNHEDGDDDVDEGERKKKEIQKKRKSTRQIKIKKKRKQEKRAKQTTFSLFLSRASITLPTNNTLPFPPFVCFIRHGIASCFIPASFFVSHIINTFLALGPSNAPSCLCVSCFFCFGKKMGLNISWGN